MYRALPERGYDIRVWPAEIPENPRAYRGRLAPFVLKRIGEGEPAGQPLDPDRFSAQDLAERRASYGRAGYALQFLLDDSRSDGLKFPLKLSDLMLVTLGSPHLAPSRLVWGADPELMLEEPPAAGFPGDRFRRPAEISAARAPFERAVLAIDPSGRGRDETGFAVVKSLNAQLYLTAVGGFAGGYEPETLTRLAQLARTQAVNELILEANFGDGMFARLLGPYLAEAGLRAAISEVRSVGQKERRIIDTLEPVMMAHRLAVTEQAARQDYESAEHDLSRSLFFQLTRLTRERGALIHDDRLDALALAVGRLGETLALSAEGAEAAARARRERSEARALKRELLNRRGRRRVTGPKRRPPP